MRGYKRICNPWINSHNVPPADCFKLEANETDDSHVFWEMSVDAIQTSMDALKENCKRIQDSQFAKATGDVMGALRRSSRIHRGPGDAPAEDSDNNDDDTDEPESADKTSVETGRGLGGRKSGTTPGVKKGGGATKGLAKKNRRTHQAL
jgi:hypothetical protein